MLSFLPQKYIPLIKYFIIYLRAQIYRKPAIISDQKHTRPSASASEKHRSSAYSAKNSSLFVFPPGSHTHTHTDTHSNVRHPPPTHRVRERERGKRETYIERLNYISRN